MTSIEPFIKNVTNKIHLSEGDLDKLIAAFKEVRVAKKQLVIQPVSLPGTDVVLKGASGHAGHNISILFAIFGGVLDQVNKHLFYFSLSVKTAMGASQPFTTVRMFLPCVFIDSESYTSRMRS